MKPKARITAIGTFTEDGNPKGWVFDGAGIYPPPDGLDYSRQLFGGYTRKELREIIRLNHKLEQLMQGG